MYDLLGKSQRHSTVPESPKLLKNDMWLNQYTVEPSSFKISSILSSHEMGGHRLTYCRV
jgi:hypothetical protein